MKNSKYNIFLPSSKPNHEILVNSISRISCEISNELAESIRNNDVQQPSLSHTLEELGVITVSPDEQSNLVYEEFYKEQKKSDELNIVLPLTSKCNLKCTYCYQVLHGDFQGPVASNIPNWNSETIAALIKFINSKIDKLKYQKLKIRWYGGEPMLRLDLIKNITSQIKDSLQVDIQYSSQIISNGVLLNEINASILKDCNVKRIEISLDGPKVIHDNLRKSKNGKSNYDIVLNSLEIASRHFNATIFRVNINSENAPLIEEWLSVLPDFLKRKNIFLKFKIIEGDISNNLTFDEFSLWVFKFKNKAKKLGFNLLQPNLETETCPAIRNNYFIVQSDLQVYKCPQNLGSEDNVGVISKEGILTSNWRLRHWEGYDVSKDEDCKSCAHLPHCNGGCPYNIIMNSINKESLEIYSRKERCCHEKVNPSHLLARVL
jgi:uncharacterized protein